MATLIRDFRSDYRLGTTGPTGGGTPLSAFGYVVGQSSGITDHSFVCLAAGKPAAWNRFKKYAPAEDHNTTGADTGLARDGISEDDIYITADGALQNVSPTAGKAGAASMGVLRSFIGDFYYRIYISPRIMRAVNPLVGVPIPFSIWNAFPYPLVNDLTDIDAADALGLTLSITDPPDLPLEFDRLELKPVTITIGSGAPVDIAALYTFSFTADDALFYFFASTVQILSIMPDLPITENWKWYTGVHTAWDGSEQRIGHRSQPRIDIKFDMLIENENVRRQFYDWYFKAMGHEVLLPFYQYSTRTTQVSGVGTSKLYFDPVHTDVRAGEYAVLLWPGIDTYTEEFQVVRILAVQTSAPTGATTTSALTFDVPAGVVISPVLRMRLKDQSGFAMNSLVGSVKVKAESMGAWTSFTRPGSAGIPTQYDGFNVLDVRPYSESGVPELFNSGYTLIDNVVGVTEVFKNWDATRVVGLRRYRIHRERDGMDFWRDFLDACDGQRVPFLMSTYREDLLLQEQPGVGSTTLLLNDDGDFTLVYYPHQTYRRLHLENSDGDELYTTIQGSVDNGNGTTTLLISPAIPALPAAWGNITRVSFLNVVRLGKDKVKLEHGALDSYIEFSVTTTSSVEAGLEV